MYLLTSISTNTYFATCTYYLPEYLIWHLFALTLAMKANDASLYRYNT
jgi:hypothetical protein